MTQLSKKLILLLVALITLNYISPNGANRQPAAISDALSQTVTVTYQKGDGKGDISETDDGTLSSRFVEGTQSRSGEYQGDGSENSLLLKRVAETSGGQTTVETKRIIIKFPNIIGGETNQIPRGAKINSAALKLVINAFNSPSAISASVYRILEGWTETESGYLKSPSWRERIPTLSESDTATQWTNFGADTPTSSESPPIAEAVQIPYMLGGTISFDITKAVENWAAGNPNNGVMLKLFQESPAGTLRLASFYSSEWSEVELHPLLEVTYTMEATPPPPAPTPTPVPAPVATPTPPSPTPPPPTPTPTPTPAPKPKPTPAPTPTPKKLAPAAVEKPSESIVVVTPKIEEKPKLNIVTIVFTVIQKRILETWESIIRLFRR